MKPENNPYAGYVEALTQQIQGLPQEQRDRMNALIGDIIVLLLEAVGLDGQDGDHLRWEHAAFGAGIALNSMVSAIVSAIEHTNGELTRKQYISGLGIAIAAALRQKVNVEVDLGDHSAVVTVDIVSKNPRTH